jgi:Zn finger protein HypA/HybF involved in hydrogenase expression
MEQSPVTPEKIRALKMWAFAGWALFLSCIPLAAMFTNTPGIAIGMCVLGIVCILIGRGLRGVLTHQIAQSPPLLCPKCGYELKHLGQQGTCPECGGAFEVQAVLRYWRERFLRNAPTHPHLAEPPCITNNRRWLWALLVLPAFTMLVGLMFRNAFVLAMLLALAAPVITAAAVSLRGTYLLMVAQSREYRMCIHCGRDMRVHEAAEICPRCHQACDQSTDPIRWNAWCMDRHQK